MSENQNNASDKPKTATESETVVVRVVKPEQESLLQDNGETNEVI